MEPLSGVLTVLCLPWGSYLDELSIAGECAAEYLALYQKLITSAHWKVYLAARGVLPYVGNLITKVAAPLLRRALFCFCFNPSCHPSWRRRNVC